MNCLSNHRTVFVHLRAFYSFCHRWILSDRIYDRCTWFRQTLARNENSPDKQIFAMFAGKYLHEIVRNLFIIIFGDFVLTRIIPIYLRISDGVWKFSCIVPIYLRHKYFASRSTKSPAAHNLLSRVLINWWSSQNTDGSLETLSIFWQANFVPAIFHRRVICKPSFHILCARWNPPISKQCSLWSAWKNPENILRFNLHNKVNYTI